MRNIKTISFNHASGREKVTGRINVVWPWIDVDVERAVGIPKSRFPDKHIDRSKEKHSVQHENIAVDSVFAARQFSGVRVFNDQIARTWAGRHHRNQAGFPGLSPSFDGPVNVF